MTGNCVPHTLTIEEEGSASGLQTCPFHLAWKGLISALILVNNRNVGADAMLSAALCLQLVAQICSSACLSR